MAACSAAQLAASAGQSLQGSKFVSVQDAPWQTLLKGLPCQAICKIPLSFIATRGQPASHQIMQVCLRLHFINPGLDAALWLQRLCRYASTAQGNEDATAAVIQDGEGCEVRIYALEISAYAWHMLQLWCWPKDVN